MSRYNNDELVRIAFDFDENVRLRQMAEDLLDARDVLYCTNCGSRDVSEMRGRMRGEMTLDDETTKATHECGACGEPLAPDADA